MSSPPPRSGQEPERPEGAPRFAPPVSPTPGPGPASPRGPYAPPAGDVPPPPVPPAPRFVMTDEPSGPPPEAETTWRGWMAWVGLFAAFAIAFLGQAVIFGVGAVGGMDTADPPPAAMLLALLVQDAAFVGAAVVLARYAGSASPRHFGLQRTGWAVAVKWSVALGAAFYLLSALWAGLIDIKGTDELPDSLGIETSTAAFVAACILVTVIAPVTEEFLFRGFFFGALGNWKGIWPAALLTGVVFGAIHGGGTDVEYLPPLMLLGVLLCLLRWKTGSLLPCIGLHAFNNAVAFGVTAAEWDAWQVLLLIVGAVTVSLLICRPFLDSAERAAPRPAS